MIRVSDILKLLFPNSLDFVDTEALTRGTALHQAIENYANGLIYGAPDTDFWDDPALDDRARAVIHWIQEQDIQVETAEERVNHAYGFCGHPDLLGKWKGREWCFDWKFAETLSEQNSIQAEGYLMLCNRPVALVQCTKECKIIVKKMKYNPRHRAVFLSGLNVLKFQQKGGVA